MASKYGAQLISSIDSRITNRPVLIAGGVGVETSVTGVSSVENLTVTSSIGEQLSGERFNGDSKQGEVDEEETSEQQAADAIRLAAAIKRGKMPKLILS